MQLNLYRISLDLLNGIRKEEQGVEMKYFTYGFPPGGMPIEGDLMESLNLYDSGGVWPLVGKLTGGYPTP